MITLTWYGQSGFTIAGGESKVLIDPFLSERDGRTFPVPAQPSDFDDVTVVLCTHEHIDHMDLKFLPKFAQANQHAEIVIPAPAQQQAVTAGLPGHRLVPATPGQVIKSRDVTIHPLKAMHGIGDDEPVVYEFLDGRFLCYTFEINGVKIFHAGDALIYPELVETLRQQRPDVLMLPINGRDYMRERQGLVGNMNENEAAWLAAEVSPQFVIPMHYDMFGRNLGDPGRFAARLHAIAADNGPVMVIPSRTRPFKLAL